MTKIEITPLESHIHFYLSLESTFKTKVKLETVISQLSMEQSRLIFQVSGSAGFQAKRK